MGRTVNFRRDFAFSRHTSTAIFCEPKELQRQTLARWYVGYCRVRRISNGSPTVLSRCYTSNRNRSKNSIFKIFKILLWAHPTTYVKNDDIFGIGEPRATSPPILVEIGQLLGKSKIWPKFTPNFLKIWTWDFRITSFIDRHFREVSKVVVSLPFN